MSIYSKLLRRLKNPFFCCQCFFLVLFLALTIGSAFLLRFYSVFENFTSQERINDLFLANLSKAQIFPLPLNFVGENSLKANIISQIPSNKVLAFFSENLEAKKEILEYLVEPGDNLLKIAEKFNISLETILWANDLTPNSTIQPGQRLIILPVSGVLHYVKAGDTLSELIEIYGGNLQEVIAFNDLSADGKISVGDLLIIPGGKKPAKKIIGGTLNLPLPDTLFICPISSPCRITQGLHWYNAIDFSNGRCSEEVFAVAGGEVQKIGYSPVAGNYIRILHSSGIVTFYGHLSKILVKPGQEVSQGQIIGYTGYSGYTIPAGPGGCHLHFEVRGARNPFAK